MRKKLTLCWLMIPVGLLALHFGPGQYYLAGDVAGGHARRAELAATEGRWEEAAVAYAEALADLPPENHEARHKLAVAQAKIQIKGGQMIAGQENLEALLEELEPGTERDGELARAVRHELATASYYAAWLMRLEGASPEEWKPETERARRQFRLLAERSEKNDVEADVFKRNLEAAIRLERMDLSELLAKPLPKDCPKCKNLSQRKRKQCQSRCKEQAKGKGKKKKKKEDARKKIKVENQGAGLNQREGAGS